MELLLYSPWGFRGIIVISRCCWAPQFIVYVLYAHTETKAKIRYCWTGCCVCVCFTRPENNQKILYTAHIHRLQTLLNRVVIVFDQTVDLFLIFNRLKKKCVQDQPHTHRKQKRCTKQVLHHRFFRVCYLKKRIFRPRSIALVCVCVSMRIPHWMIMSCKNMNQPTTKTTATLYQRSRAGGNK